jgi:hypothetical protein
MASSLTPERERGIDRPARRRDNDEMNFFACPACSAHVKRGALRCPHCGASTIWADGTIPRTAVALALGLTAASTADCTAATEYGISCTSDSWGCGDTVAVSSSQATSSSSGASGGASGSGGLGGAGGQGGTSANGGGGGASASGGSAPSAGGSDASGGASGQGGEQ